MISTILSGITLIVSVTTCVVKDVSGFTKKTAKEVSSPVEMVKGDAGLLKDGFIFLKDLTDTKPVFESEFE